MRTQELLARSDAFSVEPSRYVSSRSRLEDDVWDLDTDDPGHPAHGVRIRWWTRRDELGPPDEPEMRLLLIFKKIAWLALTDSFGLASKPAGLFGFGPDSCRFVRFLAARGICGLDEITPALIEAYCTAVVTEHEQAHPDDCDADRTVAQALARLLRVPSIIWRARRRLGRAGLAVPASDPLAGATPADWAESSMAAAEARVLPIPAEVFLQIVNTAAEMVTEHASEILHAQERWFDMMQGNGSEQSRRRRATTHLRTIRFKPRAPSSLPWPSTLVDPAVPGFGDKPSVNLIRLILALRDACAIIILATTGVRPSEFVAIPAGWNDADGLPDCIRRERTADGLMEVFLMRSRLTKGQIVPVDEEWVIGSSPTGSAVRPLAVTALIVLERLLTPWRALSSDPVARRSLYVRPAGRGLSLEPAGVKRPLLNHFNRELRRFYSAWVDFDALPDRSDDHLGTPLDSFRRNQGATIQSKQFRKNYSQYLLRTDSGLLPALRRQYKHTSVITLQYSYTSNSPAILTGVQDEHRLASVRAIADMLGQGSAGRSGRLPEIIARHTGDSANQDMRVFDATEADARGLALIPGEHGSCGIAWAPHLSRCNQLAGAASFFNTVPSFRHRNPTTCSGCPVFSADKSNLEFWRRRHANYEAIWNDACAAGLEDDYKVADTRRRSALAHVKILEARAS